MRAANTALAAAVRRSAKARKSKTLRLGPVVRDIVEILSVGTDLLEQPPSGFDGGEVLLALIFSPALFQQAVGSPDALQGAMTERQIELADQATGSEGGELVPEFDHPPFNLRRGFAGLPVRRSRLLEQPRGALLLEAAQPFANRGDGGGEQPGGRLD